MELKLDNLTLNLKPTGEKLEIDERFKHLVQPYQIRRSVDTSGDMPIENYTFWILEDGYYVEYEIV